MKMTKFKNHLYPLIFFLTVLFISTSFHSIEEVSLSQDELELYNLINSYRKTKGLHTIKLSRSLTYVAQLHARDLTNNNSETKRCNMHSWSKNENWEGCCYTADHKNAECMWFKPRQLTNYSGIGYEIVFYSTYPSDHKNFPLASLKAWKNSKGHNDIIINNDDWETLHWRAMGVGIYKNYAVVWFGDIVDEEKEPEHDFY